MSVFTASIGSRKTRTSKTGHLRMVENAGSAIHRIYNIEMGSQLITHRLLLSHKVSDILVWRCYFCILPLDESLDFQD